MPSAAPMSARSQADAIEILIEAAEIVAGHSLDLEELLRALRDLVGKVVDYQVFAVLLRTADGAGLRIRSSVGYRPEVASNLRIELGEGITGTAAQRQKTLVVDDVRHDPRYLLTVDGVRSEIAVPLVARGELVGVIDLQSTELNAFGEREKNLLELIGSRFSLAIEAARMHRGTLSQNRVLATLSRVAQEFSHILNLDELLSKVSHLVRRQIRYDAFSILLIEKESQILKHYFGVRFDERIRWNNMPVGQGIVGAAAKNAETVLVPDTGRDERYVAMVEGIRSEVAVPLMVKDEVIGVLDLECEQVNAFTREHVWLLSLLAPPVAIAIENARLYEQVARNEARLERDLRAARELQQHLLPASPPQAEGIEIAARNDSATEISGDLYDFFPLDGERLGILIGDVSGKGAPAALYGALVSGLMREMAADGHRPSRLLLELNRALLSRKIEARYLTALYAEWNPAERTFTLANAGLPRPLLYHQGSVTPLDVSGIPLGLMGVSEYEDLTLPLAPGDTIVFASDGITESEDTTREQFGDQELAKLVERHGEGSPDRLLDAVFEGVNAFTGVTRATDDRTVIVVKAA